MTPRIAILYQAVPAPSVDGAVKPTKPGGYSDSGADIAFALRSRGVSIVTPNTGPDAAVVTDWVWPDTAAGIQAAIEHGATVLWANTALFSEHPLIGIGAPIRIVGQHPDRAGKAEDKHITNARLLAAGLPITPSLTISADASRFGDVALSNLTPAELHARGYNFPLVIKPIRGRGSQGVTVVADFNQLQTTAQVLLDARNDGGSLLYGSRLMLEEYLPGEEFTVSIMPPGLYQIGGREIIKSDYWALPPIRRFSHHNGVAPYNGVVAVTANSEVFSREAQSDARTRKALHACVRAADLLGASAPVRIDCRLSRSGSYMLFDCNMKPNMTGPGRPGRDDQDSLMSMAARSIGWDYTDLLLNMLAQAWIANAAPVSALEM